MFGCCYNPFIFMRRPMFGGFPQTGSFLGAARMEAAANAATAALYPYSWYSNYGGQVQVNTYDPSLPLETVMHLQNMQANPYYVPEFTNPIDYASQQRAIQEAQARGRANGLKKVLEIKYTCTLQNVNAFAQEVAALLQTEGLTDDDKNKIQAVQNQIEALKQKMIQYAQTSANTPVEQAIADVEAMAGELLTLKDSAKQLAQTIASSTTVEEEPAEEVPENPEQVNQHPPVNEENPVDNPVETDENIDVTSNQNDINKLRTAYREELVPIANQLINHPEISADDKKAIKDKCEAVIDAFKSNKPAAQVAKIYNELIELLNKVNSNIAKNCTKNSAQICADLYTGANGIDWSGKGEQKIKAAVNRINKYNVLEVMKQWEDGDYNSKTGDECIIDTIKHEFNWSTDTAKQLINHILNCLKEAAKDLELLEVITPEIATITGEMNCSWWDEEKMYNAFNRILAILGVKNIPGEQVKP